ncbi:MAG: LysR family transcriptional regulator [Peptococcaceae bacterium]|nr:LysR family transcriptional regulator [Peptococcaceae bacterium]
MLHDNYVAFKMVAECKSFSKAAKQLHLSQPAISVKIQALEELYGTKLFDRVKQTNLTESGKLLYEYVVQCLKLHEATLNAIYETIGSGRKNLRLGATLTIGEYILPKYISQFIKNYPNVKCHLEIGSSAKIAEMLLADELDLGLLESPISHPQLQREDFIQDELVLVVPPNHRWAHRKFLKPKDILQERFILLDLNLKLASLLEKKLKEKGINEKIEVVMEVDSIQTIKEATLAGLGIAVIPACTVQRELKLGFLKTIKVSGWSLKRDLNIYYKNGQRSIAAEDFLNSLTNLLDIKNCQAI